MMAPIDIAWIILFLIGIVALGKIHRLAELHHLYFGAVICLAALLLHWPLWVSIVGLVLIVDDDIQHVAEAAGWAPPYADFTPIHRLGAWLVGLFNKGQ